MNSEIEIVNALDPRCLELETAGYTVVGQSWGAHLCLSEPIDLSLYAGKISALQRLGYRVESLEINLADKVLDLEITNNADYPYTPATAHAMPNFESTSSLWKVGSRVFFQQGAQQSMRRVMPRLELLALWWMSNGEVIKNKSLC